MIKYKRINKYEKGLYFVDGELKKVYDEGTHFIMTPFSRDHLEIVSEKSPWLAHRDLKLIVKSGLLQEKAAVIDLKDNQRALVWFDGRFEAILAAGLYVIWNTFYEVKIEIFEADTVRFTHKKLNTILKSQNAADFINEVTVEEGHVGLYFKDGEFVEQLQHGRYAFWKNAAKVSLINRDLREQVIDIAGQEIMTADKVTLRINAVVQYKVKDPLKTIQMVDDVQQALYRNTQLSLRAVIGTKELDSLLMDKNALISEVEETICAKAAEFGISVNSFGVRDIILPGEMKEILNRVITAKKEAEANLIARREEVAAKRSQANTAKMLENNPTLMRLHELEVLEKIAVQSKFNIVLGEKGLGDKVINML